MLIFGPRPEVNEWVHQHGGGKAYPDSYQTIGWVENGQLTGGLVFHDSNGIHCLTNIALLNNKFPLPLLRAGLLYPFSQLKLKRLTFFVSSANLQSQTLVRRLGAVLEATLQDTDPSGNTLIYALFPENCTLWKRFNGQILRLRSPSS